MAQLFFHSDYGRFNLHRLFLSGFNQCPFCNPMMEQIFKNLGGAFHRYKMLSLKIGRPCLHSVPILDGPLHSIREYIPVFHATPRADFNLALVCGNFNTDRWNIKNLAFFIPCHIDII